MPEQAKEFYRIVKFRNLAHQNVRLWKPRLHCLHALFSFFNLHSKIAYHTFSPYYLILVRISRQRRIIFIFFSEWLSFIMLLAFCSNEVIIYFNLFSSTLPSLSLCGAIKVLCRRLHLQACFLNSSSWGKIVAEGQRVKFGTRTDKDTSTWNLCHCLPSAGAGVRKITRDKLLWFMPSARM